MAERVVCWYWVTPWRRFTPNEVSSGLPRLISETDQRAVKPSSVTERSEGRKSPVNEGSGQSERIFTSVVSPYGLTIREDEPFTRYVSRNGTAVLPSIRALSSSTGSERLDWRTAILFPSIYPLEPEWKEYVSPPRVMSTLPSMPLRSLRPMQTDMSFRSFLPYPEGMTKSPVTTTSEP